MVSVIAGPAILPFLLWYLTITDNDSTSLPLFLAAMVWALVTAMGTALWAVSAVSTIGHLRHGPVAWVKAMMVWPSLNLTGDGIVAVGALVAGPIGVVAVSEFEKSCES